MATVFNPLLYFMAPSGDVMQRLAASFFSPALTFNFAGDAAVEGRIVADVASYGSQIGWLNEIALAGLQKRDPDPDAVTKLTEAVAKIDVITKGKKCEAYRAAVTALDFLAKTHPDLYKSLMEQRRTDQVAAPSVAPVALSSNQITAESSAALAP